MAAPVDIQRLPGGGKCVSFRPMGCGKQEHPLAGVIQAAEFHDLALPGQRGNGKSIAHSLAERGEMGNDPIDFLSSADMPAESSDHFVQDQQATVLLAEQFKVTKKIIARFLSGGRFQNQACNLVGMFLEQIP